MKTKNFDNKLTNRMTLEIGLKILALASAEHQTDYSQDSEIDALKMAYATLHVFGGAIEGKRYVEMTEAERTTAVRVIWSAYTTGVLRELPDHWAELLSYKSASAVSA